MPQPDYGQDCRGCQCPRLDELERQVAQLWEFYEAYHRAEQRNLQVARQLAARAGGELVSRRDIQRITGCRRQQVDNWVTEADFPPRVQIGSGRRPDLYSKHAVTEWLEEHYRKPKVRAALRLKQLRAELEQQKGVQG